MILATLTPKPEMAASAAWLLGRTFASATDVRRLRDAASGNAGDQPTGIAGVHAAQQPTEAVLGRVLVVDDEALVRRTLVLFLTRAGFAAVAVESGAEALEWLGAGKACDLLVTDQSMPGMTGCELIGAARDLRPGLPALLISGYDMAGGAERLPGDVPLLRKPVERAAILGRVRALLSVAEGEDGSGS